MPVKNKKPLSEKETRIMLDAFMYGQIYALSGDRITPAQAQKELVFVCTRAANTKDKCEECGK